MLRYRRKEREGKGAKGKGTTPSPPPKGPRGWEDGDNLLRPGKGRMSGVPIEG